jgi:hypothetical protein
MGKLMVTYKGKTIQYLINTQVQPYVADKIIEDILKHYPAEVPVDFIEMW